MDIESVLTMPFAVIAYENKKGILQKTALGKARKNFPQEIVGITHPIEVIVERIVIRIVLYCKLLRQSIIVMGHQGQDGEKKRPRLRIYPIQNGSREGFFLYPKIVGRFETCVIQIFI